MAITDWHRSAGVWAGVLLTCLGSALADTPAAVDPSGQVLSEAEKTWRSLVAQVPDLGTMGFRHHQREPLARVPLRSEVAPERQLCRYERDLQSNVMRRRCYREANLSRLQRQSRISPTMYVKGVRQ